MSLIGETFAEYHFGVNTLEVLCLLVNRVSYDIDDRDNVDMKGR